MNETLSLIVAVLSVSTTLVAAVLYVIRFSNRAERIRLKIESELLEHEKRITLTEADIERLQNDFESKALGRMDWIELFLLRHFKDYKPREGRRD